MEELVETACKHMMTQLASTKATSRWGYCVLFFSSPIFESPEDGEKWFISHIAPMEGTPERAERSCMIPVDLIEPRGMEALSLGGAYTHLRGQDTSARQFWRPTLFFNQRTQETWDRDVLVFSVEEPETCTIYSFIGFSRVVTVRHDDKFVPIGTIYNDQGIIQALKRAE